MVKKEPDADEGASRENLGAVSSTSPTRRKRKASPSTQSETQHVEKGIKKEAKALKQEDNVKKEEDTTKKEEDEAVGAEIATMQSHQDSAHDVPGFLSFLKPDTDKTILKALEEIYPLGDGFDKTPINNLLEALAKEKPTVQDATAHASAKGLAPVIYRFNMHDLRIKDNRGLALAAYIAKAAKQPLLTTFIFAPGDYHAHDRSAVRIDFVLRNLCYLQAELAKRNIPLITATCEQRKEQGAFMQSFMKKHHATLLFGNIEYEIDELRRDLQIVETLRSAKMHAFFVHDTCVMPPGRLSSGKGHPNGVYSPYKRAWMSASPVTAPHLQVAPPPAANDASVRQDATFAAYFDHTIPDAIPGFELKENKERLHKLWPAGTDVAEKLLVRFITTLADQKIIDTETAPLDQGKEGDPKKSRLALYGEQRSRLDIDGSSRLSPYLAAGCISARTCVRAAVKCSGDKMLDAASGPSVWIQEVIWRDFYMKVLAAHPHVSMGESYKRHFDAIKWEYDKDVFQKWCEGKTGVPIVDAGMRQLRTMGWCHNRVRMIVAMYLVKHLMIDWRWGEKFFSQNLIDGDFAANNGGWQWVAGCGTDAAPYFRIFAPHSQSEKCDPKGDYIRRFVPELKHIKGNAIHAPHERLDSQAFSQLKYPKPLVDHKWARERCLRRFKDPGVE